jgi:hypothetical protein
VRGEDEMGGGRGGGVAEDDIKSPKSPNASMDFLVGCGGGLEGEAKENTSSMDDVEAAKGGAFDVDDIVVDDGETGLIGGELKGPMGDVVLIAGGEGDTVDDWDELDAVKPELNASQKSSSCFAAEGATGFGGAEGDKGDFGCSQTSSKYLAFGMMVSLGGGGLRAENLGGGAKVGGRDGVTTDFFGANIAFRSPNSSSSSFTFAIVGTSFRKEMSACERAIELRVDGAFPDFVRENRLRKRDTAEGCAFGAAVVSGATVVGAAGGGSGGVDGLGDAGLDPNSSSCAIVGDELVGATTFSAEATGGLATREDIGSASDDTGAGGGGGGAAGVGALFFPKKASNPAPRPFSFSVFVSSSPVLSSFSWGDIHPQSTDTFFCLLTEDSHARLASLEVAR